MGLVYFLGIVHTLEDEQLEEIGKRFHLDRYALGALAQIGYGFREVIPTIRACPDMKNSELWRLVGGLVPEVLVVIGLGLNSEGIEDMLLRVAKLSKTRLQEVSGTDLLNLGLSPGPLFQEVLDRIRDARLDGEVASRREELHLAARLVNRTGEGG
jgi:tRNA nucleotidyltransferase (CCA-adding enzyme)